MTNWRKEKMTTDSYSSRTKPSTCLMTGITPEPHSTAHAATE